MDFIIILKKVIIFVDLKLPYFLNVSNLVSSAHEVICQIINKNAIVMNKFGTIMKDFFNLVVLQFFSWVSKHIFESINGDLGTFLRFSTSFIPFIIWIFLYELLDRFFHIFQGVNGLWSSSNEWNQIHLIKTSIFIGVHIFLHVFNVQLCGIHVQASDDVMELGSVNVSVRILVEKCKDFSNLSDLPFIQLLYSLVPGHFIF